MIEAGQRVDDRYELRRLLGSGGTGAVWLAHDELLRRDVALKTVGVDVEPERLAREARAAARVAHPAVVAVYDAGTVDDRGYLVMEFVDGQDLGAVMRHDGPLAPAVLAAVARDLAAALAAVHAAGLVHRDVTPGNLVATRVGTVKLTDLGTARIVEDDGIDRVTRTGVVVGTVDYLAPEQLSPDPVGPAADVYAAGLVLRTLATGERPFGGGTVTERAARRLTEDPRPPTGVPSWVVELVASCCHRDVAARPADGRALASLVDRLVPADEGAGRSALARRVAAASGDVDDAPGPGEDGTAVLPVDERGRPDGAADGLDGTARLDHDVTRTVAVPGGAAAGTSSAVGLTGEGPADGTAPGGGRPAGSRGRRLLGLATVVVLLLVAVALATWSGGVGTPPTPLPVTAATDHDPGGDDGAENRDAVPRAIDDDATSAWTTVSYRSADLGGLKDGVGLVLDLGEVQRVREVQLVMAVDGATVEAWVSTARPEALPADATGADLLGTAQDAAGSVTIEGLADGRYVTLWFTSLGGPDEDGDYRAGIADVEVRG